MVNFLNKVLKLQIKINKDEIERYNTRFITNELKNEETDIIYKIKNKNIFFLIEHQTKIDYSMPLRILKYEVDIIKSAIDLNKVKNKKYKLPEVISIVLYTGRRKWNANKYIKESQEKLKGYREVEFAKYNIVDVNKYTEEELLKEKSFLSKAMLIEKTRHTEDLKDSLVKIAEKMNEESNVYSKEQKELLIRIIELTLKNKIGKESVKKIKEILNEKGGYNMLAVLEMIEEENKKLIEKGKRIGRRDGMRTGMKTEREKIVRKLKARNMSIDEIIEITELNKKQIEKIK